MSGNWLPLLGQDSGCFWHLAGRGQGCWSISHNAQDGPTTENHVGLMSTASGWGTLASTRSRPPANICWTRRMREWMNERMNAEAHVLRKCICSSHGIDGLSSGYWYFPYLSSQQTFKECLLCQVCHLQWQLGHAPSLPSQTLEWRKEHSVPGIKGPGWFPSSITISHKTSGKSPDSSRHLFLIHKI